MSGTKGIHSTVTQQIQPEQLRVQQARMRELERKQRLGRASQELAQVEKRYQTVLKRLDEAQHRLPDLYFVEEPLPVTPSGCDHDPARLESHVAQLECVVLSIEQKAQEAIAKAERELARRIELARTHVEIQARTKEFEVYRLRAEYVARRLNKSVVEYQIPYDDPNYTLEQAQQALRLLNHTLNIAKGDVTDLENESHTADAAMQLGGTQVTVRGAQTMLDLLAKTRKNDAQEKSRTAIEQLLSNHNLVIKDVPEYIQIYIRLAIEQAHEHNRIASVEQWLSRYVEQKKNIRLAHTMFENTPSLVSEYPDLQQRWERLKNDLQHIANGFSPLRHMVSIEREYRQLSIDAQYRLRTRFSAQDILLALQKEGFDVQQSESELEFVATRSDYQNVFVLVSFELNEEGNALTALQLFKETERVLPNEAQLIDKVCGDLVGKVQKNISEIHNSTLHQIEHKRHLPYRRRPKTRQQAISI